MQCDGCVKPDCGKCGNCIDKKKFGGPGKRKKGCMEKKCTMTSHKETVTDAASLFLSEYGWKVQRVAGDGNCLFRCLSLLLFGVQDWHFDVRTSLVNFINNIPLTLPITAYR